MPIVRIEDPVRRDAATRHAVTETVYRCLREVFKVSDEELQARYHTYDPQDFRAPGDRDEFIQVEITVFKGRKLETKRQLYQAISQALSEQLRISATSVLILLKEHDAENWGMRGGQPACEIDFGYAIDI
ncbi:tautomerase family protein [Pseudomonas sp. RIT-PI-S]|uniref:tautomerase family protein n=1 Tax=Pseudomonas sp. RIT-PI-S TaxID=3035295 RepID=UPI0021DAABED|nr:tautomerase family protein [Pseudomonas sp. RIT-PI-S]